MIIHCRNRFAQPINKNSNHGLHKVIFTKQIKVKAMIMKYERFTLLYDIYEVIHWHSNNDNYVLVKQDWMLWNVLPWGWQIWCTAQQLLILSKSATCTNIMQQQVDKGTNHSDLSNS